jgi:hypothetical protein
VYFEELFRHLPAYGHEVKMGEIAEMAVKAENIRNAMNEKARKIERLIEKAKETGEELPPELLADFEREKQNLSEINQSIDNINDRIKKINAKKRTSDPLARWIFHPILKTAIWFAFPVVLMIGGATNSYLDFITVENRRKIVLAILGGWVAYTILLIALFLRGLTKKEAERQQAVADMLNSFIGQNIDEVLAVMPLPAKSVKHQDSQYISYYWIKSRRSVYGIRLFAASGSVSKDTLTLFVDPATSAVVKWARSSG